MSSSPGTPGGAVSAGVSGWAAASPLSPAILRHTAAPGVDLRIPAGFGRPVRRPARRWRRVMVAAAVAGALAVGAALVVPKLVRHAAPVVCGADALQARAVG